MKKYVIISLVAFILGLGVGAFLIPNPLATGQVVSDIPEEVPIPEEEPVIVPYQEAMGSERASPADRINESHIRRYKSEIHLKLRNTTIADFNETNSMDPLIDSGAQGIQLTVESVGDIQIGDIVAYEPLEEPSEIVLHRVVEIGEDGNGWYAITKGDNNAFADYGKVRFNQ